jgi:hypothetical protein
MRQILVTAFARAKALSGFGLSALTPDLTGPTTASAAELSRPI